MFEQELGQSIASYRVYNSELRKNKFYEYSPKPIPVELKEKLERVGHQFKTLKGKAVVQAIQRTANGTIFAASDQRKLAEADGY